MIRQIVESLQKNFEENFPSKPKTEGFSLWGWWKSATPGIEEINDDILDLQTLDQVKTASRVFTRRIISKVAAISTTMLFFAIKIVESNARADLSFVGACQSWGELYRRSILR